MKLGIGIDTGGTCTDAVVYRFSDKKILAFAKTHTTKDDLSRGIGRALERLPRDLVTQAEVIALSTTLATNACVENKGGRAKLVLFGVTPDTVIKNGAQYGLTLDDSVLLIPNKTKTNGDIVEPPDWNQFATDLPQAMAGYEAAGVVEMYAKKTGAVLEQEAARQITEGFSVPVVCGNQLFDQYNILKRGASTLLNARLISIIDQFTTAVKKALADLDIPCPFVIVRSDGSLMTEKFAKTRPIETLLCGPVASVMGASELASCQNALIVDMGGTTTDIAFVKNGEAKKVQGGVHIGQWNTFVKGLFVDTFGLGGDSGVVLGDRGLLQLESEKVMPLSMVASRFPSLLPCLRHLAAKPLSLRTARDEIYLTLRDIEGNDGYSSLEQTVATAFLRNPQTLADCSDQLILPSQLERLIREGVIIRCGVTPTDVMHVLGDFTKYSVEAAQLGLEVLAQRCHSTVEDTCAVIYDMVKRKLYCNIVRILLEDSNPEFAQEGIGPQLTLLIDKAYDKAKAGGSSDFLQLAITTPATLIGVGAPTHIFLEDVGKLLGTQVVSSEYAQVANALGAVVGNVCAKKTVEVVLNTSDDTYQVFGCGQSLTADDLEEAKALAKDLATKAAQVEATQRGANQTTELSFQEAENVVETDFGSLFLGYQITATVTGELDFANL